MGDPAAADWFYLPVRLRSSSDGHVLRRALEYVQAAQPWFNATGGKDHFVLAVGGCGAACACVGRRGIGRVRAHAACEQQRRGARSRGVVAG